MSITTKEQERNALSKIREILETIDADGYVNTALEGVLEIAEMNIENDWACSLKEQVESATTEINRLRAANYDLSDTLQVAKARIAELEQAVENERSTRKGMEEELDMAYDESMKSRESLRKTELNLSAANREIIELKARLYDYMTAKKEG